MEANYFIILYWFCHTSTWIRHGCTRVPNLQLPSHLPPHTIPLGHPSAPAPSILYPASNLDWRFISYMILVHGVAKSWTQLSDFTFTLHFHALEKEMATHSSALAWRIPGTREPGELPSMGSHRVGHDWRDLVVAAAATCFNAILPNHPCSL